ncbi:radical SAM protein [Candidatus Saccharibacteria bacterium]|nr:radical SAM protein [Candidatus Saccharibacteria bacterium]
MQDISRSFVTHDHLQIVFQSIGCRFQLEGRGCYMCSYGHAERNLTPEEVREYFDKSVDSYVGERHVLVLDVFGSILDEAEFPLANREVLIEKVAATDFHVVIFETHYTLVSIDLAEQIRARLPGKFVKFEFGVESWSERVRESIGKTTIVNAEIITLMRKLNERGFGICINVLVGMPNMSVREQVCDAVSSIERSFDYGANTVVLFPINLKKGTKLLEWYELGTYQQVSQWLLLDVLLSSPKYYLDRVYLSYTGDKGSDIKPISCNECGSKFQDLWGDFRVLRTADERYELLCGFRANTRCDCLDIYEKTKVANI